MGLLLLIVSFSQMCFAIDLGISVYHLHQALNYWGLADSGDCPKGEFIGQKHLKQISHTELKGTEFSSIHVKVSELYMITPEKSRVVQTEKLRMNFSEALQKWGIEHKLKWHMEIQTNCPHAPKVN